MKIGIIREDKIPVDKRTPLTPKQCLHIKEKFSELTIYVQESRHRCFTDSEYLDLNIKASFKDRGIKNFPIKFYSGYNH